MKLCILLHSKNEFLGDSGGFITTKMMFVLPFLCSPSWKEML